MSKRGLPTEVRMRHDIHYVEELAGQRPAPVGRLIGVDHLDPNPLQPRVEIGDLTELSLSIRDNGVLEPLLVRPSQSSGRWMIIAGERRWRAATLAGLREVPCIEMDVDDRAVAEIALIENMQRKDLTTWEEADGLAALCTRFGYTHEEVARKVGKSRTTVTESLSIAALPPEVKEQCRRADISAKSLLLQIVRQPDDQSMQTMIDEIVKRGLKRDEARVVRRERLSTTNTDGQSGRAPTVFRFHSSDNMYTLNLRFNTGREVASEAAVIDALRSVIEELEKKSQRALDDSDQSDPG